MFYMTLLASLIATLLFSAAAIKTMSDAEVRLPVSHKAAPVCELSK